VILLPSGMRLVCAGGGACDLEPSTGSIQVGAGQSPWLVRRNLGYGGILESIKTTFYRAQGGEHVSVSWGGRSNQKWRGVAFLQNRRGGRDTNSEWSKQPNQIVGGRLEGGHQYNSSEAGLLGDLRGMELGTNNVNGMGLGLGRPWWMRGSMYVITDKDRNRKQAKPEWKSCVRVGGRFHNLRASSAWASCHTIELRDRIQYIGGRELQRNNSCGTDRQYGP
jgi:hypothetical protein